MVRSSPAVLAVVFLSLAASAGAAQQVPPPGTSPAEIQRQIDALGLRDRLLSRLQTSGMTPDQVRRELARRGYDPSVLDPYLDSSVERPPAPSGNVLSAVEALGLLQPRMADSLLFVPEDRPMPDSSRLEMERNLRVFGLEVFQRGTSEFDPVQTGPVPPGYVLGPGDELVLILTGDVERSYNLPVTRDGFIVIPQVGQVWVNGLTLETLRNQLYTHLGRAYSGVRRGPEATTQFQVSLGQLRPNQVFVSGQVIQPGSYLVSSVASALNALYQAGGPTPNGSFRDVRIMRNGEMARRVDLYDYLLRGDNLSDVRLEPGDVVFVPVHEAQVSIRGEVANPAIYEVRTGETLLDLIQFAGGLTAPANVRRARITRIVPPEERTVPGVDRVTLDVDLARAVRDPSTAPSLRDGDDVRILAVRSEVRNTISIQGGVWREGTFRYEPGMRAWDLIARADGLSDDAYTGRAQIVRLNPQDSTLSIVPFSLETGADGQPVENPVLQEHDAVRVFSEAVFTTAFPVTITGEVRNPVTDTFYEGMTLRDLILQAEGLTPRADVVVEIARLPNPERRAEDQTAEIIQVPVDSSFFVSEQDRRHYLGGPIPDDAGAAEFQLQPYDRVMVRPLPDLEFSRSVKVRGEVRYPGTYTLQRKDERLLSVLERSGGLTATAFPGGMRFFRDGTLVSVDLAEALRRPEGLENLVLLEGDSVFVPEYNPVVLVQGAINSPDPVAVLFQEGEGLDYYIENAGGFTRYADRKNVNIRYANGEGATTDRFLVFQRMPAPGPGSVVTVPALRDEDRTNWPALLSDIAQVAAALTTVALVIARL